jgi:hypothetical protein
MSYGSNWATSGVLEVISRSAFDLQRVFETVAESAVRLCEADKAFIFRFDGELLRMAVAFNASEELRAFVERNPIRQPPNRSSTNVKSKESALKGKYRRPSRGVTNTKVIMRGRVN